MVYKYLFVNTDWSYVSINGHSVVVCSISNVVGFFVSELIFFSDSMDSGVVMCADVCW